MTEQERDELLLRIEHKLENMETLMGALGWGLVSLLQAMKEDEKVRSQMRAQVSKIKDSVEEELASWFEKRQTA